MLLLGREMGEKKRYFSGTHRTRAPSETFEAYRHLLPRMGITRLANVTGLDTIGLPVFMAIRPNSRNLSVSQGKGADVVSAKVSAMMESIESWHAETFAGPIRYESPAVLRQTRRAIDLGRLPLFGEREPRDDVPLRWVEAWDLVEEKSVWVPHEIVHLDYVFAPGHEPVFARGTTGLASGNHVLEATVHALAEIIERDAAAMVEPFDEPFAKSLQLDPETVRDPVCRSMLNRLADANVGFALWDITSDLDVPTYRCTIFDPPGPTSVGAFNGYGCHLDPAIALSRAVSEAIQSRLTFVSGSRDDIDEDAYRELRGETELASIARRAREPAPARDFSERSPRSTASFEGDLAVLIESVRRAGIPCVAVVDLTQSEIGIPVVKVVAPGLEDPFTPRYAPGPRARAAVARRAG